MTLEEQITVNQFAQSVRTSDDLLNRFSKFTADDKKTFLIELSFLIMQSKPIDEDVESAIDESRLKPTFTPCILLRTHRLVIGIPKVITLPQDELSKAYLLLLHLFKRAYLRRYEVEKGPNGKWWYADLSDPEFVQSLLTHESTNPLN
ncbi:MAG: DUF5958 family protein [Dyadobacter fermentans]